MKRQLDVYENMERSVDKAVEMAAAGEVHRGHVDLSALQSSVLAEFSGYPINPQRRLQQAVAATTRAIQLEKERDLLLSELSAVKAELTQVRHDLESSNTALDRCSKPVSFLANKLRQQDDEIVENKKVIAGNATEINNLTETKKQLLEENASLRHRLELLLKQRGEVEALRVLLAQLQREEEEGPEVDSSSDNDDVEAPAETTADDRVVRRAKATAPLSPKGVNISPSKSVGVSPRRNNSPLLTRNPRTPFASSPAPNNAAGSPAQQTPPRGLSYDIMAKMTTPAARPGPQIADIPGGKTPAWHSRQELERSPSLDR